MRDALADKLKDPTTRNIRLYDLRHYFCTKKLNNIGNPYTVMVLMGHTKLTTTQRYMHLLNFNDDEWTCTGATTAKEATKLIENGFQYVTTIEGQHSYSRNENKESPDMDKKTASRQEVARTELEYSKKEDNLPLLMDASHYCSDASGLRFPLFPSMEQSSKAKNLLSIKLALSRLSGTARARIFKKRR